MISPDPAADRDAGLIAAMLDPAFYPHDPPTVELRETHISWVFVAGELVYKLKKPVVFPFLDYGTLERRLHFCREEIRLNRRLAPEIYIRVVGIRQDPEQGYGFTDEDDLDALEYAVEMRRLEERRSLAALVQRSELRPEEIWAVARLIAGFHADAPVAPPASLELTVRSVRANLATLRDVGADLIGHRAIDAAAAFTDAYFANRPHDFRDRAGQGLLRDCHGDLRAEHVIVPLAAPPLVYDCIEFNPDLRLIDVACDLAFLVMDLTRLGAQSQAEALLNAYREAGGDTGDDRLVSFYAAYRAWVRSLVACERRTEVVDDGQRSLLEADAVELFRLGRQFAWRTRRPLVLVICGVSGSGKTTLARGVSAVSGWTHLSSDVIRRELAGIPTTARARSEHYTPDFTRRTYRGLGDRARRALADGGAVIVDATFHLQAERAAFRDGLGETAVRVVFVECEAPLEVLLARVATRELDPQRVSDANVAVVRSQLAAGESLDEVAPGDRLQICTDASVEELVSELELLLDAR